jgi:TraM recognition site of TraD and TraG
MAGNDERTAKRISDALGTATDLCAQRNYAGHRLLPWQSHVMVSRQETARPLLTPGEVMQLPPTDELVLGSTRALPPQDTHLMSQRDELEFQGSAAMKPEAEYETTVERIVITPATVGRWRKNLQPFSVLRSFEQAQAELGSLFPCRPVLGGLHHVYHMAA